MLEGVTYVELFGSEPDEKLVASAYRDLAKKYHPDSGAPEASDSNFQILSGLYAEAVEALKEGTYGAAKALVLTSKKGTYRPKIFGDPDINALYPSDDLRVRIAPWPTQNPLILAEREALKKLKDSRTPGWFPVIKDAFVYRSSDNIDRAVTVFEGRPEATDWTTLADLKPLFPNGLDPLDISWMWRRALMGLMSSQEALVIHGSIRPENIVISGAAHGLMIENWCYSVAPGTVLSSIPSGTKSLYPPEVLDKKPVNTSLDIYMMAKTFDWLTDSFRLFPQRLKNYFAACMKLAPTARPTAELALRSFDDILELIGSPYYPRRYREFKIPAKKGS